MAITIRDVQKASENGPGISPADGTHIAITFSSTTAGDSILVAQTFYVGSGTPIAPVDTQGNIYTQIGSQVIGSDTSRRISLWLAANIVGGASNVVTAKHTVGASWRGLVCWCIANSLQYNSDFASHVATGTNPTSGTTSPAPPAISLFIALCNRNGGFEADTAGWNTEGVNGFTAGLHTNASIPSDSNVNLNTAYKINTVVDQCSWTASSSDYASLIASFSEVGIQARVTQEPVEVLELLSPDARITQEPVEIIETFNPDGRFTQLPVEILQTSTQLITSVLVTQLPVEALFSYPNTTDLHITQITAEDVRQYSSVPARITQAAVEDAFQYADVPARITQVGVETGFKYATVPTRVTQVAIELLRTVGCFSPCLDIAKTDNGATFSRGQINASYEITVTNNTINNWEDEVIVTDTLPVGLTLVSMSGDGWFCVDNVCSRSDNLLIGESYPAITVLVNVNDDAPDSLLNTASVSGGCDDALVTTPVVDIIPIPARTPLRWVIYRFDVRPRFEEQS